MFHYNLFAKRNLAIKLYQNCFQDDFLNNQSDKINKECFKDIMRQIINIQVGRCGNQIANNFWQAIAEQHGIDTDGKFHGDSVQGLRTNVYFNQNMDQKYTARAILTDLQPGILDSVRASSMGRLYSQQNYISGRNGAANNWAKGKYTEGSQIIDSILDMVRKQAQNSDHLQGFQMTHSLGGGTGSGLGSYILQKIKQEYSDKIVSAFSVFPSAKVSDNVVQPYNLMLSSTAMIQHVNLLMVLDNEALYDICSKTLKINAPTYDDLNHLISTTMTGVTCCLRFPGQLNSDLRKLAFNLVPFPRMHFFMTSIAPLTYKLSQPYRNYSAFDLVGQVLTAKNMMCAADPRHGRYLTGSAIFRGKISTKQVEQQLFNVQNRSSSYFVQWIPNNIKSSYCDIAPKGLKNSVTFIGNSSSITQILKRVGEQFTAMFRRKAFLHWYTSEGQDEMQFSQAQSDLHDLVHQYQQANNYTAQQYEGQIQY